MQAVSCASSNHAHATTNTCRPNLALRDLPPARLPPARPPARTTARPPTRPLATACAPSCPPARRPARQPGASFRLAATARTRAPPRSCPQRARGPRRKDRPAYRAASCISLSAPRGCEELLRRRRASSYILVLLYSTAAKVTYYLCTQGYRAASELLAVSPPRAPLEATSGETRVVYAVRHHDGWPGAPEC
jgi:hypothetical protein